MQVIPVIDLKGGVVVHAKQGRRDAYQPIHTALCPSADIFDVIEAYLELYDFGTFYIADLDALEGKDNHEKLIHAAAERFPNRNFWLDSGLILSALALRRPSNLKTVLGSESLRTESLGVLDAYSKNFVLSLDFRDTCLGAKSLFTNPDFWPNDIIIMTLERVGSNSGPDIEKLTAFRKAYPGKNFIAAGGIRNQEDLAVLQKIGIKQALVASALHSGAIGRAGLAAL